MKNRKKIAVIGCAGKMGKTICKYLLSNDKYELASAIDINQAGTDLSRVLGIEANGIVISDNLKTALVESKAETAIDFTVASSAAVNAEICLNAGVSLIIGTTGIKDERALELGKLAEKKGIGLMIVPNFSIGAILMMEFAQKAAKYMNSAEIIELHHSQKRDKPSGTAIKTRRLMLSAKGKEANESDEGVIPIHSVRLNGLVAHQMVILGDEGQTLTIKHDSIDRSSFMPGIGMALAQIDSVKGLQTALVLP